MLLPSVRYERPLGAFRGMLEDLFNDPFFALAGRDITGTAYPRVDIEEKQDHYLIRADLPGLKREDFDVSVENNVLTISGEKKEEKREEKEGYRHLERTYGSFSRSFALPEHVDAENIDASYKNGVLELQVKKTREPEKKAKRIEVKE